MPDTARPARRGRIGRGATAILALLLYALLIDAALETYRSSSTVGLWVAIPVALYVSFTLWLLRQQPAGRPGAKSSIWVSSFLFLALLAYTATVPDGLSHGVRVAGYPTSTVMSATMIAVIGLAVVSLASGSPLPIAARILVALAGCYGLAAFGAGIVWHRSFVQLMQGHSLWERLPYWLQGAFAGALVVVPLAFVVEVGVALARVKVKGRRHRIVAFALALAMAYAAFTAAP
jgi:hypothetical protein